jgi:23S rRNA (uracil1939-C5)-methyltransferase
VSVIAAEVSCIHAGTCAGCPLIHLPYAAQLAFKEDRLRSALAPYPFLRPAIEPIAPAEPRESYRGRAKLMVSASPDAAGHLAPTLGLFARSTTDGHGSQPTDDHQVVDIPECRVLRPRLMAAAAGLRELLRRPPHGAGGCLVPEAMGGRVSAFDLREVVGTRSGVLITLVLRAGAEPSTSELEHTRAALRGISEEVLGVAINYRPLESPQVLGSVTRVLWGTDFAPDHAGSAYHLASYGSFVQAHRGQSERIAALLSEGLSRLGLPSSLRLLDLYGGSGALSLSFAKKGARVTLVESFPPAAAAVARAAADQHIEDFTVRVGDAAKVLGALAGASAQFDAVFTNPPRRGMAPEVRQAIAALKPRAIGYVSCDPDTLARDLAHLARLGYAAERLRPIDMIPLTDQVETVAVLLPVEPAPLTASYEDADLCVLEKPAYTAPDPRKGDTRLAWAMPDDVSGFAVWSRGPNAVRLAPRQVCLVLARGMMASRGRIGKKSIYARLAKLKGHSLLRVTVERGSVADLRRDLAQRGHPVVGDGRCGHGPTNRHFEERYLLDRPFLHCVELCFSHPRTRSTIEIRSDVPGELGMVLTRLGHSASVSANDGLSRP